MSVALRNHHFERDQFLPAFDGRGPFGGHPITRLRCLVGDPEPVIHKADHPNAAMCSDNQRVRLTFLEAVTDFECWEKCIDRICGTTERLRRILIGASCSQDSDGNGESESQTSSTPHTVENSRSVNSRNPPRMRALTFVLSGPWRSGRSLPR